MKHRGFTLVELLVVIVIISILAASLLLSSRSGEDHAYATTIINDLRTMKTGATLFVVENYDFAPVEGANYAEFLGKYMDNGRIMNDSVRYAFFVDLSKNQWWVGVELRGASRVGEILEAKNSKLLLYGSDSINTPPSDSTSANVFKRSNKAVWSKAR